MSGPSELSFDEILKYMLAHNGKVTNHELVKHFRVFLTNPDTREEARSTFKKHVNSLASINNVNNEKWLILKRKYMSPKEEAQPHEPELKEVTSPNKSIEIFSPEPPQYRMPPPVVKQQDSPISSTKIHYSPRNSIDNSSGNSNLDIQNSNISDEPPKLYPRRKSSNSELKGNTINNNISSPKESSNDNLVTSESNNSLAEADQTVSVKERKQMFNKMASDVDVLRPRHYGNRGSLHGVDEEDRVSVVSRDVEPLDAQQKQWILLSSRGDYNALSKMCHDNPKLVRTKDPFTGYTALHWASKHGNLNMVKMLAGMARKLVNERSNGGYTPLHIAKQFRHDDVYRLLIEVYDADANIRDWSGRKPKQYLASLDTALSPDAYRKFKIKSDKKNLEKEGFLRIGSLNVRVKKTTEAFSNFLGVGASRASAYVPKSARSGIPALREESPMRKNWGSADNVSDDKLMPPPSCSKVRKRGSTGRRGVASHSLSTPTTPDQSRARMDMADEADSDSDSAAGFTDSPNATYRRTCAVRSMSPS